jgi:hypothetical protein
VVSEPPANGDIADRDRAKVWISQVLSGTFEPLLPNPPHDRVAVRRKDSMQIPDGDVVFGCDDRWIQPWFVQVPVDEGPYTQYECPLPGLRRLLTRGFTIVFTHSRGDVWVADSAHSFFPCSLRGIF